jgi:hypothetical protein
MIVSFKTAKLASEKGYDGDCLMYYNEEEQEESCFEHTGEIYFTKEDIEVALENEYLCYLAPTQSELQTWLRGKHIIDINVYIVPLKNENGPVKQKAEEREYHFLISKNGVQLEMYHSTIYSSYEEALEEGLLNALTLIEI